MTTEDKIKALAEEVASLVMRRGREVGLNAGDAMQATGTALVAMTATLAKSPEHVAPAMLAMLSALTKDAYTTMLTSMSMHGTLPTDDQTDEDEE